ncbi:MAG: DNA adenine methylase [Gammaproteobacteria bacterium]|nr:DNA adenine methylase [Gammaproteobacteria bacterium]
MNSAAPLKQSSMLPPAWGERERATAKSPLRYPGGKSRAVNCILDLLPPDIERLCSPFIGGGSVELALAARGIQVFAYDAFQPLVNFWRTLLEDAAGLAGVVERYYPMNKDAFYALQKRHSDIADPVESAAVFFALNRCSFSGTTLSGGMSPGHPRFTDACIKKLSDFKSQYLQVARADFSESIPRHRNDFLYLDPPYCIASKLYGTRGDHHQDFDHEGLAKLLSQHDSWLLSYNDCETVRELYNGYPFKTPTWTYGMNASRVSNEVLIMSRDYATKADQTPASA